MVNAKALWESLERKYKTEDAGSKKFVVGKFLDFKMVDSKTVISQVQEFQLILHDIHAEGMVLGESFQVAALIEKLPPTWKDFKNYLKHKRKEMKLEDLIVRLRIEEDNRQSEKKAGNYHQEAKANVVEQDVLSLYPGRLSSRTVSTIAGRISLKDSESNSRLDLFPLLFCNLLDMAAMILWSFSKCGCGSEERLGGGRDWKMGPQGGRGVRPFSNIYSAIEAQGSPPGDVVHYKLFLSLGFNKLHHTHMRAGTIETIL
ncbi:hypothetical protein RJ639_038171 [Escallonia herrerae]|uniref:Zinc finger, CCHC-type n=1 Tax=Escallonia herrerae TaxID=1293975 RepID=A0AA88WMB8_9ASTE|nr:hypothetical protein RJ639_038171 [Escallonia herrerae]